MTDQGGGGEGGGVAISGEAAQSRWERVAEALWRRSFDRVVLLAPAAEQPRLLSPTAAAVWHLLEEPATLAQLVEVLADVFEGDAGRIAADVEALLAELEGLGAVRRG